MTDPRSPTGDAPDSGARPIPPGATGHTPPGGPRDAETQTVPGTGVADQRKAPTTQISATPAPSQQAKTADILKRAQAQKVPQPGQGKIEHVGEPGEGAEEVGKDTGTEPGKNVGLQTVSAEAHALALDEIDKSRVVTRNSRKRITEEEANRMSPAELRAVATDRGYEDILPGGRRSTMRAFLKAQEEDKTLEETKVEKKAPPPPIKAK